MSILEKASSHAQVTIVKEGRRSEHFILVDLYIMGTGSSCHNEHFPALLLFPILVVKPERNTLRMWGRGN